MIGDPTDFQFHVGNAARALGVKLHFSSDSSKVIDWGDNVDHPTDKELNDKIAELVTEHEGLEWARKRKLEYPNPRELVVALYDTDDKAAIDARRAAVKAKWPKDNSGPVE